MKNTKKPLSKNKTSKPDRQVSQKNNRQDEKLEKDQWLKSLIGKKKSALSKTDAEKVMDYLKEEFVLFKKNKKLMSGNRFNLRRAVHYLNNGGYEVLGYNSLKACFEKELANTKSLSTLYREADAARLETLFLPDAKIGKVAESVLRPLSKLKKDDSKTIKVWKMAMQNKSEKSTYPTAKNVKDAVNALIKPKLETKEMPWNSEAAAKIAKIITPSIKKQLAKYSKKNIDKRIDKILSLIKDEIIQDNSLAAAK